MSVVPFCRPLKTTSQNFNLFVGSSIASNLTANNLNQEFRFTRLPRMAVVEHCTGELCKIAIYHWQGDAWKILEYHKVQA